MQKFASTRELDCSGRKSFVKTWLAPRWSFNFSKNNSFYDMAKFLASYSKASEFLSCICELLNNTESLSNSHLENANLLDRRVCNIQISYNQQIFDLFVKRILTAHDNFFRIH